MDKEQSLESVRKFEQTFSTFYVCNKTGALCFYEDEHKCVFDNLKSFYVKYLDCDDEPIENSRTTTAEQFALGLMHLIKAAPVISKKSEYVKREEDIIKHATKLLELMEGRPSRYMSDHTLYNKDTNIAVVRPKLQVAAIIEGSQERLERLKAAQAKRSDLMKGIQFNFISGGYPELQDKELNAQTLATLVLYLTGQGVCELDTFDERDKKEGKWYDLETRGRVAQSDSIEYKEAVKFLKKQ